MSSVTTNSLRTSLRRAASCSRYSSTSASSPLPLSSSSRQKLDIQPKAELTEDKMRVLVELYHQSASFITKANLSAKIDDAFIRRRKDRTNVQPVEWSMARLEEDLHTRRNRPKFGQMLQPTVHKANDQQVLEFQEWSERRSPRETAVFSALYGVHSRAKPGYDALMDEQRGTEEEDVPKDEQEAEVGQREQEAEGVQREQSSA